MTPDNRDPVVDRLFDGLEAPAPPQHLRARVLSAARAEKTDTADVWSRIWNHRGLRFAWAAAVVMLLAGHVLIEAGNGTGFQPIDPNLTAENRVDEQLGELLRPIRISDDVRPIVGLFAASNGLVDLEMGGNPS